MDSQIRKTIILLAALALAAQGLAMLGVARFRGSPTAYAYSSPDSAEYVALARGLANTGRFVPLDAAGRPLAGPDTWRTPGYPAFLAIVIRLAGDGALALLIAQQIIAAATVPMVWSLVRRFASPRWSMLAAVAWLLDPFRLYYSLWLLAETLFVFVLLAAVLVYVRVRERGWTLSGSLVIGLLAGALVLIRPAGLLLPVLAVLAAALDFRGHPARRRLGVAGVCDSSGGFGLQRFSEPEAQARDFCEPRQRPLLPASLFELRRTGALRARIAPPKLSRTRVAAVCLVGVAALVGPWLLRNRIVAGHWALSHQSGDNFAYRKVADVVLWSQGRHRERFDAQALDEVRIAIDQRLRHEWRQRFGPLTPRQEQALTWTRLNFGRTEGIDPFVASSLLWKVGRQMLAGRGRAMAACFTVQGLKMLVFPLGLVLDPPAGQGSAPFSLLGGGQSRTAQAAAAVIGSTYAVLAVLAAWGLLSAARRRCWPGEKKGSGVFCAKHPSGRSGKRLPTPFFLLWHRRWPAHFFAVWLILALLLPTLPFEDPRFRLPLVPFLWLLAVSRHSPEQATCERKGRDNQ